MILYLDLVDCTLQEIIYMIRQVTEIPSIIEGETERRRFILQKDYNVYFVGLLEHFKKSFPLDMEVNNIIRALLIVMQNNIFFNITKSIKLIKFYKLKGTDDVRILLNCNAFKNYLMICNKRESEGDEVARRKNSRAEDEQILEVLNYIKNNHKVFMKQYMA